MTTTTATVRVANAIGRNQRASAARGGLAAIFTADNAAGIVHRSKHVQRAHPTA